MPTIATFYGILIKMYFSASEHNPPHIHAIYGEYEGMFDIQTLELIEGDLPTRGQKFVKEWMSQHQNALLAMWNDKKIHKLPPLV